MDHAPTLAVCVAGELRSATCTPSRAPAEHRRIASPIDSIVSWLSGLGMAHDIFAALDNPPVASAMQRVLTGLRPRAVSFTNASEAQTSFEHDVRNMMCIKPSAYFQARKLQACWRLIVAREREVRREYEHVVRLRPDLMMPYTLARQVALHLAASSRGRQRDGRLLSAHAAPHSPRSLTHLFGDDVCLRSDFCQYVCKDSAARRGNASEDHARAFNHETVAHLLTIPPFTQPLMDDTFVNDVFYVVDRTHAPALFNHLSILAAWASDLRAARTTWHRTTRSISLGGGSCGAAPHLLPSPRCDDPRWLAERQEERPGPTRLTCATGGHECMLTQGLVDHVRQQHGRGLGTRNSLTSSERAAADADAAKGALLRVRYLGLKKWAPQVLRLADADPASCQAVQQAYLCSEKRKLRHAAPAGGEGHGKAGHVEQAAHGNAGTKTLGVSSNAPGQVTAASSRLCKSADHLRKTVHTREAS